MEEVEILTSTLTSSSTCATSVMIKKAKVAPNWALCWWFRFGFKVIWLGKFGVQITRNKVHLWNQQKVQVEGLMSYCGKGVLYEIGNPREHGIQQDLETDFCFVLGFFDNWNKLSEVPTIPAAKDLKSAVKIHTMKMYWLLLNYAVKESRRNQSYHCQQLYQKLCEMNTMIRNTGQFFGWTPLESQLS